MTTLSLLSSSDIQLSLSDWVKHQRKLCKYSRDELSKKSTVPTSTIRRFETTGQISLRQFLLLWQCVDNLDRINNLTKPNTTKSAPASIEDVLSQ